MSITTPDPIERARLRRKLLLSLPYVRWVQEPKPCGDLQWSRVPLKVLFGRDEQRAERNKYRCKTPAHWQFRARKNSDARSGIYCMVHLFGQLEKWGEQTRFEKYVKRFKEKEGLE